MTLRDEVTGLLQELIRVDTVNPPGNETPAAELLRDYLEGNGVRCELHARAPERANLVARLPGRGGPSLLLLAHTDTVLADPASWSVDPWSGELRDGCVWGRGALDMKGQLAASAVALASLAREGFEPAGDLVFAATADEESDTSFGLEWLVEAHPEAVRTDFAINEGGGDRIEIGGRPVYLCSTAEKMSAPFRLLVRGRSGHASTPSLADNAFVKAAHLVARLGELPVEPRLIPEAEALLALVLDGEVPPAAEALALARAVDPRAAELIEPILGMTLAPTMVHASEKRNVVPALCEVTVDCRLLPGDDPARAEALVRSWLGDGDWDYELIEAAGGSRSPAGTPLWEAVRDFVERIEPRAALAPICVAGFTDSHYLRRLGTVVYGFFPMRAMAPELAARVIHSDDERVPVDDLELGLAFLRETAAAVCGG